MPAEGGENGVLTGVRGRMNSGGISMTGGGGRGSSRDDEANGGGGAARWRLLWWRAAAGGVEMVAADGCTVRERWRARERPAEKGKRRRMMWGWFI
uniref:Retrotransposon protein, putative, Ty3-gypsy subclass n=1 Tax=Oryza sativa subsp. japonica TaxID=39947 RepID=Q2R4Q0_ORYSJ|nr:retrotransposon protein, putative, Ty3-gypsy subclass [Oryza sativa Japonica Group]